MLRPAKPIPFAALASADLTVGQIYKGGSQPNVGADPLHHLTGVGNSGGFRKRTLQRGGRVVFCVLFTTGKVSEWPDGWQADGNYVYFGDQRTPGKDLLDTPRKGNRLFADIERLMSRGEPGRSQVPPFLLFKKSGNGRDVVFEGLLVPARTDKWLKVEHRSTPDGTISNYRATLERLPVDSVSRLWLQDVEQGVSNGPSTPKAWLRWVKTGTP